MCHCAVWQKCIQKLTTQQPGLVWRRFMNYVHITDSNTDTAYYQGYSFLLSLRMTSLHSWGDSQINSCSVMYWFLVLKQAMAEVSSFLLASTSAQYWFLVLKQVMAEVSSFFLASTPAHYQPVYFKITINVHIYNAAYQKAGIGIIWRPFLLTNIESVCCI